MRLLVSAFEICVRVMELVLDDSFCVYYVLYVICL